MEQNRELEARLEQALHRWKLEKETSTQETEKYIKMRSTCATLVEQLNQSSTDAAQLADRLGEYLFVRLDLHLLYVYQHLLMSSCRT